MDQLISVDTGNILTKNEQMDVARALAEFRTPAEVQDMVKDHFGKDLAYNSIKHYLVSKKWKPIVERLRAEYVEPIMSIPVSHKFMRLKRLEDMYVTLSDGALMKLTALQNLAEIKAQMIKPTERYRLMKDIIAEARTEIEGSKSTRTGDLFLTQINNYTDAELKKKRDEIIARVKDIDGETTE